MIHILQKKIEKNGFILAGKFSLDKGKLIKRIRFKQMELVYFWFSESIHVYWQKLFHFQDVFDGRTVKLTDNMDACDKSVTEVF